MQEWKVHIMKYSHGICHFDKIIQEDDYYNRYHRYPGNMLDENLAIDWGKPAYIATLPKEAQLIEAAIEQQPLIVDTLWQHFGILTLQRANPLGRLKQIGDDTQ